jgi:hypothetical protein
MRFMMLMIPKVYQGAKGRRIEADFTPGANAVEKMKRFNEELAKAGALIALEGLHPPKNGARVSFRGGKARVTVGPFKESRGIIGGYWLIQARSKDEALEWARRCPAEDGDVIEIRQVFESSDWPEDTRKAAESSVVQSALDRRA